MEKKSIVKNYIYNLIYQMLTIVLPLVTTPYLSRVLGAGPIGIYGYTLSIVTYFILFGSLGIAMYGQREIAYVQEKKEEQSKTFWEIVIFRVITMTVALIIFYLTFCLKGEYSLYYKILILELVANAIDISWYFQGVEDFGKTVVRNIIVKSLSLVCIFIFIKSPEDLWKYFLIYTVANVFGNLTMWMYIPEILPKVRLKDLNLIKHIKPTLALFVPQIATQIYVVLDKTMVGNITGNMSEVGYYEQAQKIVKALMLVVTALGTVMSSRIANTYATKSYEEVKEYLRKSFKIVWFLGMPIMLGLIAITPNMVPWFYGEGFEAVIPLLIATSPIILAIGLNNVTGIQYLIQTGKQNIFTISVTVGAVINVIFNFVLIKIIGTVGASISSVLAEVIILFVQLYYLKEEITIKDVIEDSFKYIISGIIMAIIVYGISLKMNIGIISTLIQIIIGGIIYVLVLIILKDELIKVIISQIATKIKVGD
mgnify:FL=1